MRRLLLQGLVRSPLTEQLPVSDDPELAALSGRLDAAAKRRLGRSLSIRAVDAGSCNGCELEINALNNAFYDLERFGLKFVASPRHADVLFVTGPVTKNMREALERTYAATPSPKWVVAVGNCAVDGGIFKESYAVVGGVSAVVPVDLPRLQLVEQCLHGLAPPVQVLASQHAQLDLGHVPPTAVLRGVMDLEPLGEPAGLLGRERRIQAGQLVRIQVVHHQPYPLGLRVHILGQPA